MPTEQTIKKEQDQVSIIPVYPEEVSRYWPLVHFMIAEAIKYGGSYAEPKHIKEELEQDRMQLFIMFGVDDDGENKVFGCMTTRIYANPNFDELQACICTGKKMHLWIENLINSLEKFAKDNGCKRICMLGRPGYKKFVSPHGWKVKHYEYQKELA